MSALTIRLPNSVHAKLKELAQREEISLNQFVASAVSEKMASVLTAEFLRNEGRLARRGDFTRFLAKVPDSPAAEFDRLPPPRKKTTRK